MKNILAKPLGKGAKISGSGSDWPDGRLMDWWHDGSASTTHPHDLVDGSIAPGKGEAVQDGAYPLFDRSSVEFINVHLSGPIEVETLERNVAKGCGARF